MEKAIIVEKQKAVDELTAKFKAAKTIVAVDYHGISVLELTEVRRALRAEKCEMKIYKNNISRRAAEAAGFADFGKELVGPKAIAMSNDDVVAPAKVLYTFAQKNPKLILNGGVVEGEVVSVNKINELATLPSIETLLTQLAAGMLAPIRDLAIGLNMMTEKEE